MEFLHPHPHNGNFPSEFSRLNSKSKLENLFAACGCDSFGAPWGGIFASDFGQFPYG